MSDITFRPLEASDIEVRVSQCSDQGCSLLLYKDARCDMRLLDDAVGAERWSCDYQEIGNNLYCTVSIKADDGEWIHKQDVGTPSNMEGEKGCASDAFKRACFKWGIGRELYTAPYIWVSAKNCNITKNKQGKHACYDRFSVDDIEIKDGRIVSVFIKNDKTGKIVFPSPHGNKKPKPEPKPEHKTFDPTAFINRINELFLAAIELGISAEGIDAYILAKYNVDHTNLESLTKEQLTDIGGYLNTIIADKKKLDKEAEDESA